ncbi:hypothetical protein [Deferribacter abyssi]|uniref:hypothetical protein n=1 Tax=Deferribacter abyssi TaxID=213806 RepID=UPI003C2901C7
MNLKDTLIKCGFYEVNNSVTLQKFFKILNSYKGNYGYITVEGKNFKTVLIKGTYKNFIKEIKSEHSLPKSIYTKIAEIITSFERDNFEHIEIDAGTDDKNLYLLKCKKIPKPIKRFDKRDILPFPPLTHIEYSLFHDGLTKENTLYSNNFFSYLLPETLSPFSASLFKIFENVLNPFFMENNIKTLEPSIKHIFGKPFINKNNLDIVFRTLKGNDHFYLLNYAPHLFLKLKKIKFKEFDLNIIKNINFENYFDDARNSYEELNFEQFLDNLFVVVANLAAIFFIFFFKFNNAFTTLYNTQPDISKILKVIYLSRQSSLITNNQTLYPFFDFSYNKTNFSKIYETTTYDLNTLLKEFFPKTRLALKKKKLIQAISEIHNLLDIKDRAVLFANNIFDKVKKIIENKKDELVENHKLKKNISPFNFDFKEFTDIYSDNFYANYLFNYCFKIWQFERYSFQIVPNEIFEEDIPQNHSIVSKMISKFNNIMTFHPLIFFEKEIKGKTFYLKSTKDEIETDSIIYSKSIPLPLLPKINKAKAIIVESAPVYSYLMEYATVTDTSIITGLRFSPMFFGNSILQLKNKTLTIEKNSR